MKVNGRFANCDGNGCKRAADIKKPFRTELVMNNGRLIDTNMSDNPSDHIEFSRAIDESEFAETAKTALIAWLRILDAGDFGRFYDQATTASFRSIAPRKDFIDRLSAQRDQVGSTISRQLLKAVYVQRAPFISKASGNYVIFWSGVDSTKSAGALEFMLLVNDGGAWKVTWLNYGS
jgi:hypothetical protein